MTRQEFDTAVNGFGRRYADVFNPQDITMNAWYGDLMWWELGEFKKALEYVREETPQWYKNMNLATLVNKHRKSISHNPPEEPKLDKDVPQVPKEELARLLAPLKKLMDMD